MLCRIIHMLCLLVLFSTVYGASSSDSHPTSRISSEKREEIRKLIEKIRVNGIEREYPSEYELHRFFSDNIKQIMEELSVGDKTQASHIIKMMMPSLFRVYVADYKKFYYGQGKRGNEQAGASETDSLDKIIWNIDGYEAGVTLPHDDTVRHKGIPIKLDDGTPIGYNIFLPRGEVKAVLVTAYGGWDQSYSIDTRIRAPILRDKDTLYKMLLKNNIAVITLNLADSIESYGKQHTMPEAFHKKIHDSIHHFAQIMRGDANPVRNGFFKGDKDVFLWG